MKKSDVLEFFGSYKQTAVALDITDSAVRMWPDELTSAIAAKVFVAAIQMKGSPKTRAQWPEMFERGVS